MDKYEISKIYLYQNKSGELYNELVKEDKGIPVHTACWKMVKEKAKVNLVYEHFDINKFWINMKFPKFKLKDQPKVLSKKNFFESGKAKYIYFAYSDFDYNVILKYWLQEFNLKKLQNKKSEWYLLFSPTENSPESKKNAERIMKNVKKLNKKEVNKIKKDRPSPSESATQFKEGTKKKGNDGNMYIISVNKNGVKKGCYKNISFRARTAGRRDGAWKNHTGNCRC